MSRAKEIKFGLISPKMIKKLSVMKVVTSEVYDSDAYPIEGGVMDPRLGVVDPGMRCRTCGGKIGECTGHFGHIDLSRPVINILYIKQIKNLLNYTCHKCGALTLKKEITKETFDIGKTIPTKSCPKCGAKQEKIKLEKPSTFVMGKKALTPIDVREHLEKISDRTASFLDLSGGRPEWLILTIILVPPITTRPSITLESGDRSEDDLTHKLVDIIRINQRLADNIEIGAPEFIIEDLWELLQYHVSTFFNNDMSGVPPARHRSGRPLKTLSQRLKTKEGRFRHNLTGKRVNYSARTVVSPDPCISINEVGIPKIIAKELTIPIKITSENIKDIKEMIKNGPDRHPGANYIIKQDGMRKKILKENKSVIAKEVEPGYIVERHLCDGDIVLFNRQPSLHRMSVMAHKAKIMSGKTFRLNLCVCDVYNADFDGDEMNLHVPQTAEARAEAEELMLVEKNIRSPRFGGPIIGGDQEYISGAYLLTKKDTIFSKERVAQILANAGIVADLDKEEYTGKEVFSFAIPEGINLEFKATICKNCDKCLGYDCPYDAYVVIKDSKLIRGVIDSNGFATFKSKVIDKIDKEKGHHATALFLDKVTRIISESLMQKGFSISTSDLEIAPKVKNIILKTVDEQFRRIDALIERYKKGNIEVSIGRTAEETIEDLIQSELMSIMNKTQDLLSEKIGENEAMIMAKTGARGSIQNVAYMAGIVGQELVRGRRIFRGYTNRTLPHFLPNDIHPRPHGFVTSSFKKGLDPIEFFFEIMKGREGIMESSLKTRISGYMQRRLVNALQDVRIDKDGLVKDSANVIIQFIPGEDGVDPSKSNWGKLKAS